MFFASRLGAIVMLMGLAASPVAAAQPGPDLPAADAPGGSDSRYLRRYDGTRLIAYDTLGDGQATRFRDFGLQGVRTIGGRVTRLAYVVSRMVSTLEVIPVLDDARQGAGFTTVFSCAGADGCGGFNSGELLTQPMVEAHAGTAGGLIIDYLHPVSDDIICVLPIASRPEGNVTLAVAVARRVDGGAADRRRRSGRRGAEPTY